MTSGAKTLDELARAYQTDADFHAELLALQVTSRIAEFMQAHQLTQRALADRLGVSPAYVSKILAGNPNLTLKSIAKLSVAMSYQATFNFERPNRAQMIHETFTEPVYQESWVEHDTEDERYPDIATAA